MISINIFEINGDANSHVSAYSWPQGQMPKGRLIGQHGNALLLELTDGDGVAVISAPASEVMFHQGGIPTVDLSWAF